MREAPFAPLQSSPRMRNGPPRTSCYGRPPGVVSLYRASASESTLTSKSEPESVSVALSTFTVTFCSV